MNQQTDLSKRLRAHVSGHAGLATNTDNKLLLDAADEIERYYTGMMAWKQTAETKDRKLSEKITDRINERVDARIKERAALAASAPKVQMTDAEIIEIATATRTAESNKDGGYILPISFARAILARSAPNAELVAALKETCDLIRLEVADGEHTTEFLRAREALAAVGEA